MKSVFHFNPTCELGISNGSPYFVAPSLLKEFEEELATLMLFFANDQDLILKENTVSSFFGEQAEKLNLPKVSFTSKDKLKHLFIDNTYHIESWGKSPAEDYFIRQLGCNADFESWHPQSRIIFEKETSCQFLHHFINKYPNKLFPEIDSLSQRVNTIDEIEKYLEKHENIVLKDPISSSGRGLQIIRDKQLNHARIQWIKSILKQYGYLIVEKWFNKTHDLSFQFHINKEKKVEFLGLSYFITNSNGQYIGHYLNFDEYEKAGISKFEIEKIGNQLCEELAKSIYTEFYTGYLGIDAIVYNEGEKIGLHPCLEVNSRYTMGLLSKRIEKYIYPKTKGIFQIYYDKKIPFYKFSELKLIQNPTKITNGKLMKGFVPLTSPSPESKFGAYIELSQVLGY